MGRYVSRHAAIRRGVALLLLCLWAAVGFAQEGALAGGKRWAFVVGASQYENFPKLKYTAKDAKRFSEVLKSDFGFTDETVKLLTDDATDPRLTPTAGHILGELAVLVNDPQLDKGDLFIFYFSGHGEGRKSGDYLMPLDARPQTLEQLSVPVKKVIEQFVKAGLKNVLIIADACRAGEENAFGTELQELADKANIAVMLGCAPGRKSYEFDELDQSAFTHFLIKAMKDPALRDPNSGAVWASKVAARVAKDVFDYTAPIMREKYAQKPASWGDQTRDVLLGAFLPEKIDAGVLNAFKQQAGGLNRQSLASALGEYGAALFLEERYGESIEVFKTLEQIGDMTPETIYLYAVALGVVDRLAESNRTYQKLIEQSDGGFYRDLAIVSNLSTSVPVEEKIAAAKRVWEVSEDVVLASVGWTTIKLYGNETQKLEFIKLLEDAVKSDKRFKAYLEAELAELKGDSKTMIKKFREAIDAEGTVPSRNVLYNYLFVCLVSDGDEPATEALLQEAIQKSDSPGDWTMRLCRRRMSAGNVAEAKSLFAKAIERNCSPIDLVEGVKEMGIQCLEFADAIDGYAKRFPFSWRAQLCAATTKGVLGGEEAALKAVEHAQSFADDIVEFNFAGCAIMDKMLRDLLAVKAIEASAFVRFLKQACNDLSAVSPQFAPDKQNWLNFMNYMMLDGRYDLLGEIAAERLSMKSGAEAMPPTMRMVALGIFLNAGQDDLANKLWDMGGFEDVDVIDAALTLAVKKAVDGDVAGARKLFKQADLEKTVFGDVAKAMFVYLDALEKKPGAKAAADTLLETPSLPAKALLGMAYVKVGELEKGYGLIAAANANIMPYFSFVHAASEKVLFDALIAEGSFEVAEQLAFDANYLRTGSKVESFLHFGAKAEISQYVGSHMYSVEANFPAAESVSGTLTLIVGADGSVNGFWAPATGTPSVITGKIDALGSVEATVRALNGQDWRMVTKLPTTDSFKRVTDMDKYGHAIRLSNAKREVGMWFARLKT